MLTLVLVAGHLIQDDNFPHYRYLAIEQIITKLATRCNHVRLRHPFGQLKLTQLVTPEFPILKGIPYHSIFPHTFKPSLVPMTTDILKTPYLTLCTLDASQRKFAFPFLNAFPRHFFHLYTAATSTYYLLAFHGDPDTLMANERGSSSKHASYNISMNWKPLPVMHNLTLPHRRWSQRRLH